MIRLFVLIGCLDIQLKITFQNVILEDYSVGNCRHYIIFCVNGNTGFKFESRIFYFIDLQNEEDYERKESSSAR